jgi:N-ethylmaleimide reductase
VNATQPLLQPYRMGEYQLANRVVMAPLTRSRATNPDLVPTELHAHYYAQRASAGLLITEGTWISRDAVGWHDVPGLFTEAQVRGWSAVTEAVHREGGVIFAQLWHTGSSSHPDFFAGTAPLAPSAVNPGVSSPTPSGNKPTVTPRAMTRDEVRTTISDYATAAANAMRAGFDGVQLQAGFNYLISQFLNPRTNVRTDGYGGSIENRVRLLTEVVEATISVWGADRVAVRVAPSNTFHAMGDSNPHALFNHVAARLNEYGLAYLHVIEPRVRGFELIAEGQGPVAAQELRKLFDGPIIATGGFEPDTAEEAIVRGDADLIGFARWFISNPDLPQRIALGVPLNEYDRTTFYTFDAHGYTDYPVYDIAAQQHV